MRIGVLGTGMVGQAMSEKLSALGHEVVIGTRDVDSALSRTEPPRPGMSSFAEWHGANPSVAVGTFAQAAAHGEVLINATSGAGSLDALGAAGPDNLRGKILIDLSNPLDHSAGFPPNLFVANTDSLGERIQGAFPETKVVKTLNTVTAEVMVDPMSVNGGEHHAFVSGDDPEARSTVTALLKEWFGWRHVLDLGELSTARGPEMYVALWIRLLGVMGTASFNVQLVR